MDDTSAAASGSPAWSKIQASTAAESAPSATIAARSMTVPPEAWRRDRRAQQGSDLVVIAHSQAGASIAAGAPVERIHAPGAAFRAPAKSPHVAVTPSPRSPRCSFARLREVSAPRVSPPRSFAADSEQRRAAFRAVALPAGPTVRQGHLPRVGNGHLLTADAPPLRAWVVYLVGGRLTHVRQAYFRG